MHSSFPFLGANQRLGIDQVRMEVYVTHQNVSRFWDLKQSARTTRREEVVHTSPSRRETETENKVHTLPPSQVTSLCPFLLCAALRQSAQFLVKNWGGGWGGRYWRYLCHPGPKDRQDQGFPLGQSLGSASLDLSEGHSAQHAARKDGSLSHLLAGPSVGGLCSQPGSSKRWLSRLHASVAREFSLHP